MPQPPTLPLALQRATRQLAPVSGPQAPLEAEVLLRHLLALGRVEFYRQPERELTEEEQQLYQALLHRRLRHEPLAYIIGHWEFYGLDFWVDRRVLIPRPETELLVEKTLEALRGKLPPATGWRLAEVGTGSGAVAISLAVNVPGARIYAIDDSREALEVANANCQRHGVADRVPLLYGHLLEPLPEPVEAMVANLPYLPRQRLAHLAPDIRDYEPLAALDGGEDGLEVYRRFFPQVRGRLKPGGFLAVEIDSEQAEAMAALARAHLPETTLQVIPDYAGWPRVLEAQMANIEHNG